MTEVLKQTRSEMSEKSSAFDHRKWRNVLIESEIQLKKKYPEISLIGPFGFELMWKAEQSPKSIKKLYVYSNLPNNVDENSLANEIQNIIFWKTEVFYPEIYKEIVVIIQNQSLTLKKENNFCCLPKHKLLDIQVRQTNNEIITDYAEYVILAHQTILSNSGEARNYKSSFRCRSRVIQLFLMQESLFSGFIPPLENKKLISKIQKLVSNDIQIFFGNNIDANDSLYKIDMKLFDELVIPRSQMIKKFIEESSRKNEISIETTSYHIKSHLSCKINYELFYLLKNRVKETYQSFI